MQWFLKYRPIFKVSILGLKLRIRENSRSCICTLPQEGWNRVYLCSTKSWFLRIVWTLKNAILIWAWNLKLDKRFHMLHVYSLSSPGVQNWGQNGVYFWCTNTDFWQYRSNFKKAILIIRSTISHFQDTTCTRLSKSEMYRMTHTEHLIVKSTTYEYLPLRTKFWYVSLYG